MTAASNTKKMLFFATANRLCDKLIRDMSRIASMLDLNNEELAEALSVTMAAFFESNQRALAEEPNAEYLLKLTQDILIRGPQATANWIKRLSSETEASEAAE